MLDNIKSLFILKKIFNKLNEMIKLNSIIHSKRMQNKLNIDIIDYQRLSGRYIVGERNGKGKEYNSYNDKLIFEGEYFNGKRHGLGKEYDEKGNVLFEGEYLNGKINGKGKEYYDDGILQYDGEYLNGKKHGKGKEYDYDGQLKFIKEYLDDEIIEGYEVDYIRP